MTIETTGDIRHCPEPECGQELAYEHHGDETVFMCPEHGWQATVFEGQSDGSD
jgi:hypothetical protein